MMGNIEKHLHTQIPLRFMYVIFARGLKHCRCLMLEVGPLGVDVFEDIKGFSCMG